MDTFHRRRLHQASGLAASVFFLAALAPQAKADFLDDLFGAFDPPQRPTYRRAAPPRPSFSVRVKAVHIRARPERKAIVRQSEAPKEASGEAKVQRPFFCAAGVPARSNPDSLEVRLKDGTLRAGDSIVTSSGVLVFEGRAACPHRPADFVALAQARLPKAKRNTLAAIERAMWSSGQVADKDHKPRVLGQIRQ